MKTFDTSNSIYRFAVNASGDVLYIERNNSNQNAGIWSPGPLRQLSSSGGIDVGVSDAECVTSGMGAYKDSFFFKQGTKFKEVRKIGGRYQIVGPGSDLPSDIGCGHVLEKTDSAWFMSESDYRSGFQPNIVYRIERINEGVFDTKSFALPAGHKIQAFFGKGALAYVAHGPEIFRGKNFELTRIDFSQGSSRFLVPSGTHAISDTKNDFELYGLTLLPDDSLSYFVRVIERDQSSGEVSTTVQSRAVQKIIGNPEGDSSAVDGTIDLNPMGIAFLWDSLACPTGQVRRHNLCKTIVEPIKTVAGVTYTLTGPANGAPNSCMAFTVTRNSAAPSQQEMYPGLKSGDGGLFKDSSCSTPAALNTSIAAGQTSLTFYFKGFTVGETAIELFDLNDNIFGSIAVTVQEQ